MLSVAITLAVCTFVHEHVTDHGQAEFDLEAMKFVNELSQSMTAYQEVLNSGAAIIKAKPDLTQDDWTSFVASTGLAARCPGFQGIAYLAVPQGSLIEGRPPGFSGVRLAATAPSDWLTRQGLLAAVTSAAGAPELAQARDTGIVTKSATVWFTIAGKREPGFLIFYAAYEKGARVDSIEARRAALSGFVVMPFRMQGFVAGVMQERSSNENGQLRLRVYDGAMVAPANVLFDSAGREGSDTEEPTFSTAVPIRQFGRDWTLHFGSLPGFNAQQHTHLPLFVLAGGLAVSGLFWMLLRSLEQRQRQAEAARQHSAALSDELVHRVKNTLAVVQSIANRSLSDDRSLDEGREIFANRLGALARTHTLIMENAWLGADIGELVRAELAPLNHRATTHGAEISLSPQVAQSLALILHELAMDSVKRDVAALEVQWSADVGDDRVVLQWIERGGDSGTISPGLAQQISAHGFAMPAATRTFFGGNCYTISVPLDFSLPARNAIAPEIALRRDSLN